MTSTAVFYSLLFLLLLVLELVYFKIAKHFGIVDRPSKRGSSTRVTLRGGGIIFYLGFLVAWVSLSCPYPWFFIGLTLVSAISFIDDLHSLTPKLRLTIQMAAILLSLYQLGLFASPYWLFLPLGLVICAGVINIFNFMDGINGITGGYALVILGFLLYVNERCIHFVDTTLLVAMAIAVLVFCLFNFRKKAKCFAGDVGSVSIAFILLFLLGLLVTRTHDFSWFICMVVYGVDGCLTIVHRIMMHEHLTEPHRNHAFQIMANELKIPHVVVSLIYMALQTVACVAYVLQPGYLMLIIFIALYALAYVIFMKKFFYLHKLN